MLKVTCKGCGADCEVPDDFAGSKIPCKTCSEVMPIIRPVKKDGIHRTENPSEELTGGTIAMIAFASLILFFVIVAGVVAGACSR